MTKRLPKQSASILNDRVRRIAESSSPVGEIHPVATLQNGRPLRLTSFKAAKLVFPTGEAIDVIVKNFSETGARVEFLKHVELPEHVLLRQGSANFRARAQVVWQVRGAAGLKFLDRHSSSFRP